MSAQVEPFDPALGLVVASHGRHMMVETADGERRLCHCRGKKTEAVVGDRVRWQAATSGSQEGVVTELAPRRNLLHRQDVWRSKSFAANLDQILVWLGVEPVFSEAQLTRALIAASSAGIEAIVVLNKVDLPAAEVASQRLQPYRDMGYRVLELSLEPKAPAHLRERLASQLLPLLEKRSSLVLGPSGAGKSTLINALVPHAKAQVGEISQALNSGKHTTTASHWYWLDSSRQTALIDSPGFQEFGLHHLQAGDLVACMPDLAAHAGQCRFHNCTHRQEPNCAVREACARGEISPTRLSLYSALYDELGQQRW